MIMVFFCLWFLKMVGKPKTAGRVGLLMGKRGVVSTPPQTMKEICVFWLHCTA